MSTPAHPADWLDPLAQLDAGGVLPVEDFLTFRVNQLSAAFERQWTRFMREQAGVSLSEWRILAMLKDGSSTFARLVDGTGVNRALLHRSARALEALNLVTITDTPGDARSTTLTLTGAGKKLLAKVLPLALERQRHLLGVLSPDERQTLYRVIGKLRDAALDWDTAR
ncbi:MarR family winged helix-turn-helix transcriptional regulator [Bordetella genomosp. 12]|uniref:HTH marR-type domain-containing protein n=1 Tax=Bordetella genomosp. 12 TaxID=463035 RepID=A0A261VAX4_9BORD|nr:MarR family winged helix-turn-helix transcriptional regulator [Bordetella genomosp. 12]OZI71306.1 hypothetical protein CAL22_15785 [Bordetella genomosp. 12]